MKNQKLASGSSPGAPVDLRSNSPTQAAAQQTTIAELKLQVEKLKVRAGVDTLGLFKSKMTNFAVHEYQKKKKKIDNDP